MWFSRHLNALLSRFNVALIRRSTLDRLVSRAPPEGVRGLLASVKGGAAHVAANLAQIDNNKLLRHQIAVKWELIDRIEMYADRYPRDRRCPLCGYHDEAHKFTKFESHCVFGGGRLVRYQCPGCDVIFGADKMLGLNSEELSQDYEWHYNAYSESDSTDQEIRAFHALNPVRGRKYLNFGAGAWSRSVRVLRDEGWDVYAFEPHANRLDAAEYAIADRAALSGMRFDGVFSNNVLEHLRYPIHELNFMRELLRPGGRMAHATPCFEYLYEYTRFHLFFFLGRSRALLADRSGLAIREFTPDGEFMVCTYEPRQK